MVDPTSAFATQEESFNQDCTTTLGYELPSNAKYSWMWHDQLCDRLMQKGITFENVLGHGTVSALWINVIEHVARTLVPHA